MKVTTDTNFLISAVEYDYGSCYKLLEIMIKKKVKMFTTKEILEEFSDVLTRKFNYKIGEVANVIKNTLFFLDIIDTSSNFNIVKKDPDDNKILECAVDSSSDYIITYDKDLLDIKSFRGIIILKPEELLKII